MIIPFFLDLTESEIESIQSEMGNILRGGTLILGPHTDAFESGFASYCGTKHGVALNTATSALELLIAFHNPKGKKIAVASNTNFATVAAIIRAGGEPVFMDMTADYFVPNLDILKYTVEKYGVQGVAWVHIGGIIAPDFQEIVAYCKSNGIFLIEDAAHAHGSAMNGVKAGAFADGGAFSFFPTKVMTTMEGGMLTTDNDDLADYARSMRNQGKRGAAYGGMHSDLGNSWRMSEISAYMGTVQLAKLDDMIARRASAVSGVSEKLDSLGLQYCRTDHMDQASQYKFIVHLKDGQNFSEIKNSMREHGVACGGGVYEVPCHLQPVFENISYGKDELITTETWCPRHVCPPITSGTTSEDVVAINAALEAVFG